MRAGEGRWRRVWGVALLALACTTTTIIRPGGGVTLCTVCCTPAGCTAVCV